MGATGKGSGGAVGQGFVNPPPDVVGQVGEIFEGIRVAVAVGVHQIKGRIPIGVGVGVDGPPGAILQKAGKLGGGQIGPGSPKVGGVYECHWGQGERRRDQGRGDQGGGVDHARQ